MKRKETSTATWVVDYSAARAHAIRWLGDRYLLARPINARQDTRRAPTPGFSTSMPVDDGDHTSGATALKVA
ncbi:MAG: hypothetical protein WAK94_15940 [Steroidobacteraceae bacterium]